MIARHTSTRVFRKCGWLGAGVLLAFSISAAAAQDSIPYPSALDSAAVAQSKMLTGMLHARF